MKFQSLALICSLFSLPAHAMVMPWLPPKMELPHRRSLGDETLGLGLDDAPKLKARIEQQEEHDFLQHSDTESDFSAGKVAKGKKVVEPRSDASDQSGRTDSVSSDSDTSSRATSPTALTSPRVSLPAGSRDGAGPAYERKNGRQSRFQITIPELNSVDVNELCFGPETNKTVDFLVKSINDPKPNTRHGFLFHGPPGIGKSMLARIIAKRTGCILVETDGTAFVNRYAGTGPASMHNLLDDVMAINKPTIILIDEIDCFAHVDVKRDVPDYHNTAIALQQFLSFIKRKSLKVFVIATTNENKKINPTLHDRFKRIKFELPQLPARQEIIKKKAELYGSTISPNLINKFAGWTHGWSGRDLEGMLEHACTVADAHELTEANLKEGYYAKRQEKRDAKDYSIEAFVTRHNHKFQLGLSLALGITNFIFNHKMQMKQMAFQQVLSDQQMELQKASHVEQMSGSAWGRYTSIAIAIVQCGVQIWLKSLE